MKFTNGDFRLWLVKMSIPYEISSSCFDLTFRSLNQLIRLLVDFIALSIRLFGSRSDLWLENLALRLKPGVVAQSGLDCARLYQTSFSGSSRIESGPDVEVLLVARRSTLFRWRRAWTHFRMVAENPTWGSPRIYGELKMQEWAAFLSIDREVITAMDFFTVPTLTIGLLYCFFVMCDRFERAPLETPHERVLPLLPRGSNASLLRQTNSGGSKGSRKRSTDCEGRLHATPRWFAFSLQSHRLILLSEQRRGRNRHAEFLIFSAPE